MMSNLSFPPPKLSIGIASELFMNETARAAAVLNKKKKKKKKIQITGENLYLKST